MPYSFLRPHLLRLLEPQAPHDRTPSSSLLPILRKLTVYLPQIHPTVDFRHVTVNDLPFIHWVPDADPEASIEAGGEGGRLEWIDEDIKEKDEEATRDA